MTEMGMKIESKVGGVLTTARRYSKKMCGHLNPMRTHTYARKPPGGIGTPTKEPPLYYF